MAAMYKEVYIAKEFKSDMHAMINKLHKVLSFKKDTYHKLQCP